MWITPTAATVKARITGAEFEALKSAALASGQSADTLVTDCLSRIIQMIRGYVGNRHTLGTAGTIPDELESALGALWVHEFISRVPGTERLLNERRVKAKEDALTQLRDVSSGRFSIVPPTSEAPSAQQAAGPALQLASSSIRENDRESLTGLL